MLPASRTHDRKAGLAHWAQRVLEECDQASREFAPDPVHDLRVAIRRCRSMADGFMSVDPDPVWKQMKKLGKTLFASLGQLRDVQVMMEWVARLAHDGDAVRDVLLQSLAEKESALKTASQQALHGFDRKRWSALNEHLTRRAGKVPLEGLVFQHLALERLLEARELHRRALRNRSQVGYHRLRIGIKRFRYTVENFLPQRHEKWARDLRELQDALGEVHDLDVLSGIIRLHREMAGEDRARWQRRIAEERQQRLNLYRQKMLGQDSLWRIWRAALPAGGLLARAALAKLRTWVSFLDPDPGHSAHVTRLALQMYDALAREGLLRTDPDYRRILQVAATLHEAGRSKKAGGHSRRAYRMIRELKPPLSWNEEQLHCAALVARYHRGALPAKNDSYFVGLSAKRRSRLLPIIGILRLADALDQSHDSSIARVLLHRVNGTIVLRAPGVTEISAAAERIAKARYLLEVTCGLPIVIRPLRTEQATGSRAARGASLATAS
jgi:CHAD domain-containing protein